MGGVRRLRACLLALALAASTASCSRETPLCGYADGLVRSAQLADAADAYAAAERADEGDCAADGLAQVGKLRAQAGTLDAKGRAAARAGQVPAAQASFRAALAIDRGDGTATAELQRLGRTSPAPAPSVSTVLVSGPPGKDAGQGLAWLALAVAAIAVLAGAVSWWFRRRRDDEVERDRARGGAEAQRRLADLDRVLSARLSALDQVIDLRLTEEAAAARREDDDIRRTIDELRSEILRVIEAGRASTAGVDEWYAPQGER